MHPLVVFAHGYAVQTATYAALLDHLAASGAIVAAPELPGQSSALAGTPNEADLANEPCDLEFVASSMIASPPPPLADAVVNVSLVFAGHSDGATAAVAAGYQQHSCAGPRPVAVVALSVKDVQIDAVGPAPALLAVTGTADEMNPAVNTERLWSHVAVPAWLVTVDGGTHLGTFTTDPDLTTLADLIARFVGSRTVDAVAADGIGSAGRLHIRSR